MGYVSSKSLRDSGSSVYVEIFTNGVDYTAGTSTQVTASEPLPASNAVWVYFDGVVQHHSEYGISGYTVIFDSAIPAGTDNIEIQFNRQVNVGVPGQNVVTHSMMTSDNISTLLRKNAIINGNFDIWQRNTSQTTEGYGSDDRWLNATQGTTTTFSQQTFTLGQTDVPNNPRYYARAAITSSAGSGNYSLKVQRIEGVRSFAGETVTVSFWAKADATKNIAIEFVQAFGTGGSPSSNVSGIGAQHVSLTTSWAKYSVTISIPSITGKTLGSNNDDYLQLAFWFDAGTTFDSRTASLGQQSGTFDIAQVQLEAGSDATDFERRHIGDELALCQRYFWKIKNDYYAFLMNTNHTNRANQIDFPVEMRDIPTVSNVTSSVGTPGNDGITTTHHFPFYITIGNTTSNAWLDTAEFDAEL